MVTLYFHGGLHVLDKKKRQCISFEEVSSTTLKDLLAAIEYPWTEIGFAVVNDKCIELSEPLVGNEVVNLYPIVDGG